jgi:hypothetical protein
VTVSTYRRGTHPNSLAALQPANRAVTGARSVEAGQPLPFWLPWAEGVEAFTVEYFERLLSAAVSDCETCAALATSTARARGAFACIEAAGRSLGVQFATKNGVRKLWRDAAWWEDRWLTRLAEFQRHAEQHLEKLPVKNGLDYVASLKPPQ